MNKVILVGRLTRDPEVRYTQKGTAVASFSIAVNTGFGENKRADFIPIVVWDKLAEVCGNGGETTTAPTKSGYDISSFGAEVYPNNEEEIPF